VTSHEEIVAWTIFVYRLCSYALERIFAFATVAELGRVCGVCRSWQSGVLVMRPIEGSAVFPSAYRPATRAPIEQMCASRLRRHVSSLLGTDRKLPVCCLTTKRLQLLAEHLPHLHSLQVHVCVPTLDMLSCVFFPLQLRQLRISVDLMENMAARDKIVDEILATIARLPSWRTSRWICGRMANSFTPSRLLLPMPSRSCGS
jgi:hypothetical protein